MSDRFKLSDDLFPIQTFFNVIGHDSFVELMSHLLNGFGVSYNDCHCFFPNDLEFDDEPFDGVKFSIFEDEVVISEVAMREYIKLACQKELLLAPHLRTEIERVLNKPK